MDSPDWFVLSGQFESLFVSFLLFFFGNRWITFFTMIFVCFNSLYFRVFHQHLNVMDILSFPLDDIHYLLTSFFIEVNFWFFLNLTISFLILIFSKKLKVAFKKGHLLLVAVGLLLIPTYLAKYYFYPSKITSDPVLSLFNLKGVEKKEENTAISLPGRVYQSRSELSLEDRILLRKEFLENANSQKNTILIVLESVGSLQLMKGAEIDQGAFPFLYSQKEHMIIFNKLYSMYPGTTRSHMAITAGVAPTKSSLFEFSNKEFFGPTLPGDLKEKGYYTMLVSAMGLGFEELDHFYGSLGFDFIFDPDEKKGETIRINPWGIDERLALDVAFSQIKLLDKKKFYLQFLTNSTHYPYFLPGNQTLKDNRERYLSALRYTDEVISELVQKLKEMGLLHDTRIFITGDHGEAFGEYHTDNITHRNYLYEENIRNFLLVLDFSFKQGPRIVSRNGSIADIYPTILSLEESLFSSSKREKTLFFHKNASPSQWGLLDGDFKYISTHDGKKQEIYWLKNDPHEKNNLKEIYPQRMRHYHQLTKEWFFSEDERFKKNVR